MVNRSIRKNLQIKIISILISKILQIKPHLFQNLSKPNFPIHQTYSQNEIKKQKSIIQIFLPMKIYLQRIINLLKVL